MKETERPQVKQVIVRKEDVSQRMEETWNTSHINIKQKLQVIQRSSDFCLEKYVLVWLVSFKEKGLVFAFRF